MANFRRGIEAMEKATKSSGGGGSFAPTVQWREDREEKFVLFLTPADELVTVDLHEWIQVGEWNKADGSKAPRYETFISRKDDAIGENADDLEDRLGQKPRVRGIGIAIELEPVIENVRGRKRPTSFTVKTDTFNRKVNDEDTEEVTQPSLGLIIQSKHNFWGWLTTYDQNQAPMEETAMKVVRRGKDKDTAYDFIPIDAPIDLSGLVESVEGITYLNDEMPDLLEAIDGIEPDEAAQIIASILLAKRLDEMADGDRYEELVGPIEEIKSKYGNNKGGSSNGSNGGRTTRPARKSQRKKANAEDEAPEEETPEEETPEEEPEETPKADKKKSRFSELREQVEANRK